MVLDLLVLRIVGSKDKLAFGNRIGPQRTQLQRDRAVVGHFRPANAVNVLARDRLTTIGRRRAAKLVAGNEARAPIRAATRAMTRAAKDVGRKDISTVSC